MKNLFLISCLLFSSMVNGAYIPNTATTDNLMGMVLNNGQAMTAPNSNSITDIIYGYGSIVGGRWCLVQSPSTGVQGVTNGSVSGTKQGTVWTQGTTPANSVLRTVTYNKSAQLFIAAGLTLTSGSVAGSLVLSSADCVTWVARTVPSDLIFEGSVSNETMSIIVGHTGSGCKIYRSTDGLTFTESVITGDPCTQMSYSVVWTGERFVATTLNSILTSSDGINWVNTLGNGAGNLVYGNGLFVKSSTFPNVVSVSRDAINWTSYNQPTSIVPVYFFNGYFIAYNSNNILTYGNIAYSKDGITWKYAISLNNIFSFGDDGKGGLIGGSGGAVGQTDNIFRFLRTDF